MNFTAKDLEYLESKLRAFPRTKYPRAMEFAEDDHAVVVRVLYGNSAVEYRMPHSMIWEHGGLMRTLSFVLAKMAEAARANPYEQVEVWHEEGRLFGIFLRGDKIYGLAAADQAEANTIAQQLGFQLHETSVH